MPGYYKSEIYKLLTEKGIAFERMEHEAVYTMEQMNDLKISERGNVCKNLFLRDAKGRQHFLVTAPEERRIDLKRLAGQIGSTKLSFASAERLEKYLKVQQGCVSPFGILNDDSKSVIFVADKALEKAPAVGVHPNDNTATIWLPLDAIKDLISEHGNETMLIDFD